MSKSKVKVSSKKVEPQGILSRFSLEEILPEKYHIPLVLLIILSLFLVFLSPMYFGGKSFQSGDIIASQSMTSYLEKDREGFTLWNPYIFCGMPAYSISVGFTWFNVIYVIFTEARNIFSAFFAVDYAMWSFYLIILAVTTFFLMKHITHNTLVSLFSGIATSFSTGIIVFLFIGHVTKLTALCWFPLVILILLRMQERIRLLDFFILTVAAQLMIQGFHVQVIFYILLSVAVYFVYFFIYSVSKKQTELRNNIVKSAGLLTAAVVIAVLIQSDSLTQIYEYTPYSTRGGASITEVETGKSDQSESEYYEYHTNWSFSPGEVLTFIIPSYYGFGASVYKGPLSNNQEVEVNTYFGQMPFVDVAMYMGVLVFILALYAMITRFKEPLVQFLTVLTVFSLILSFGKNFPILFDLLFYNLPYFDKFRVPSMILVIVQTTTPILAGLGLMKIISLRKSPDAFAQKILQYAAYTFSGLFILSLVLNQAVADWFKERIQESAQGEQLRPIYEYMADMFIGDTLLAFVFLSVVFWTAIGYIKNKVSRDVLTILVILVTVIDLYRINARGARYTDAPDETNLFIEPGYVKVIKQQKDTTPFRILNLKQDGSLGSLKQNSNFNAYFLLEDFYGYSAIKPRAYQDLMDVVGPVNPVLWRMANVKYVITDQDAMMPGFVLLSQKDKEFIYQNTDNLGRYFFVNTVEQKKSIDVLNDIKMNAFDPAQVAYVPDAPPKTDVPDSTISISVKKYTDEISELEVNASGNNFLFFSATYHPKGWKARIDGKETKIYRTNHAFMGIVVPKGKHTVTFEFSPDSFTLAKYTSLILSSAIVLGLILTIFMEVLKKKKSKESQPTAEQ